MENPSFLNEERMPMSPVTPEIMNQAREMAQEMFEEDQEFRKVSFGHGEGGGEGNFFVISRDPKRVLGGVKFKMNGVDFFVGFAQNE